jgi:hypothetical protein
MRSKLLIIMLMAFNIGMPAAQAGEQADAQTGNPEMGAATVITANATVAAINQETREVTLQGADGEEITITASDQVRNLPQVEVGDRVQVTYYESVNVELLGRDHDMPPATEIAAMDTAAPGEKPGGVMGRELSVVATIEEINKDNETVTLKGPEGNTRTVKVRNPANLEKVAVGDDIMITLTRSVAVDVKEAPAKE